MAAEKYDPNRITLGLYTDLDTIYDTRLATLEQIHPLLAQKAVAEGYFDRVQDIFPMVSKENFEKIYSQRTVEILETAMPTNAMQFIPHFVKTAFPESLNNPWGQEVALYVNVYPYKVDKEAAKKMLEPLVALTAGAAVVNLLNLHPKKLTLGYCRDHFGAMMIYDYQAWLDEVSKSGDFQKQSAGDIVLIAPKLYERLPTDEEARSFKNLNIDAFKAIEIGASAQIGLQFVDVKEFSANMPEGFFENHKDT